MGEKLGIESLKEVSTNVLELGATCYDVFEDGKFNALTEGFQLGKSIIAELPPIIRNGRQALQELKDLTPPETKELVEHIQQKFDIADDELEAKIEEGLNQIVKLHDTLESLVVYGRSLRRAS